MLTFQIGMPVAWMLTSGATTDIITFFVRWVRDASPLVWLGVIMTDCDQAQIAALETIYPQSWIYSIFAHGMCYAQYKPIS